MTGITEPNEMQDYVCSHFRQRRLIEVPVVEFPHTTCVVWFCGDRKFLLQHMALINPVIPYGVDLLAGPGGPRKLYRDLTDPQRLKISMERLVFFLDNHGARIFVPINHSKCGKYGKKNESDEKAKEHLLTIAEVVSKARPDVEVIPVFIQLAKIDGRTYAEAVPL